MKMEQLQSEPHEDLSYYEKLKQIYTNPTKPRQRQLPQTTKQSSTKLIKFHDETLQTQNNDSSLLDHRLLEPPSYCLQEELFNQTASLGNDIADDHFTQVINTTNTRLLKKQYFSKVVFQPLPLI